MLQSKVKTVAKRCQAADCLIKIQLKAKVGEGDSGSGYMFYFKPLYFPHFPCVLTALMSLLSLMTHISLLHAPGPSLPVPSSDHRPRTTCFRP